MTDNKQADKKILSVHNLLHFYRNHVMNILVVVILVLYFALRMIYIVPHEMQRCCSLLSQNVQQAQQYQEYGNEANELFLTIQDQEYLSGCNFFINYIVDGYDEKYIIDRMNAASDDFDSVFYLRSNGTLISSPDREPLSLSEEDKTQLLSEGILQHEGDHIRYFALPCKDAYLIVRIDESYAGQITMDVLQMLSLNGFIYNNDTLAIIEADEDVFSANSASVFFGDPIENEGFKVLETEFRLISPYNSGISKFTCLKLAAVQKLGYQNAGYSICAYIPVSEIVCNILINSGLPTFLCLGFICLIIFGSFHFRRVVLKLKGGIDEETGARKTIRLPFNCFVDVELTRSILFMQLFMGLLVIFCSVILLAISQFSLNYENIKYNLEQMAATGDACRESLNECWDAYSSPALGMAEGIAEGYLKSGDITMDKTVQEKLKRYVDSTFLEEIAVYNKDGENIYTTAGKVGYPLTTNPSSAQYSFWELMSGDREYILVRSDTRDGIIYCAIKRSDAVGIVVLTFSDKGFSELEHKLSPDSIAANFHYSDSYVFVDKTGDLSGSSNGSGYRISPDGMKESCETPNLPILSHKEKFCGFRMVNERNCFVVGLGEESRSIFCFKPVSEISVGLGESIAIYILFMFLICFLDLLGCAVYTEESISQEDSPLKPEKEIKTPHYLTDSVKKYVTLSDKMGDAQRIIWKHSIYSTIIMITVTLLLDVLLNENSILAFLAGGRWEKGFNLFALSSITLIILVSCLLFRLLKFLFDELIKNFPSHFAAAIQMTHSILTILIVVILVIFCANEVGIDTSTILASVGISGLALGIAAKDTINDMLNGLFIIIDGRIQVGDFVEIGGFYGKVVKIGIRTTKVQHYNMEKSINNSDMKNLLNRSRGESSVYIQFRVAQGTDLSLLKKIITDSADRFQETCRGKLKTDFIFLGVDDFDADSITCCMFALVDEKDRKSTTRKCKQVLLDLLMENDITIGSNLVIEAENGRQVKILSKGENEKAPLV